MKNRHKELIKITKKSITKKHIAPVLLIITALIWGSGFIVSQLLLDTKVSPIGIMLGRFSIATIVLTLLYLKKIIKLFKAKYIKGGIIIGIFLFLAFYIQAIGLNHSSPSNNAFITSSNVVMVPLLWWAVSRNKPKNIMFVSSLISLAGVAVLSINFDTGLALSKGDLLSFLAGFLFACQIVCTEVLSKKIPIEILIFLQFLVASILSLAVFLVVDGNFKCFFNQNALLSVIYLGVLCTCLCYFLQTYSQKYVTSAMAGIYLSTESLFGSIFSIACGYDQLSGQMIIGGGLMVLSIMLPDILNILLRKKHNRLKQQ